MKKLLIECSNFSPTSMVLEGTSTIGKKLIVSGIIQRANTKNQNGRVYPRSILERVVQDYLILIKERRSLGELDHPDSEIITLANVSHVFTEIWWKGDDLYGKVEILDTPSGNILRKLFEAKIKLGISSRGTGSVRELATGGVEVLEDFDLIGWDFVSNPSTQGAFMNKINESTKKQPLNEKAVCRNKVDCLITEILIDLNRK